MAAKVQSGERDGPQNSGRWLVFRAPSRARLAGLMKGTGVLVSAVSLGLLVSLILAAPSASAAGLGDTWGWLIAMGASLFVGGILLAAIGAALGKWAGEFGEAVRDPFVAIGVILAIVGFFAMVMPYINLGGGTPPPTDGDLIPVSIYCAWRLTAAGGPGGAHDAVTEFPAGNNLVVADSGTPDYDSTDAGTSTNFTGDKVARLTVYVDDELNAVAGTGANNNGWLSKDADSQDIQCVVNDPPAASGGGWRTVPLQAKVTVPRMFAGTGNTTNNPVFICSEAAGGVYLGVGKIADTGAVGTGHDANHDYVSYRQSVSCSQPPTEGDWTDLGGSSTTSPQNGEWFPLWYVLDAGLAYYEGANGEYPIRVEVRAGSGFTSNVETLSYTLGWVDD